MSEVAEQTAEVVAENVEEIIDGVVEVMEVVRTNVPLLIAVGVLGAAAGAGAGYFLAKKILTDKFEDQLDLEIEETRNFYASAYKVGADGEVLSPRQVLNSKMGVEAAEALMAYQGDEEFPEGTPADDAMDEAVLARTEAKVVRTEEVVKNVFTDHTFDLDEEIKLRSKDAPYIITKQEFYQAEHDFENESLVYFEEDQVLCGEDDAPKDLVFVGEDNIGRFGHGSQNKNVVFIRNEKIEKDFEITRSEGAYTKEVLGMDEDERELRHSDRERKRAFRRGEG